MQWTTGHATPAGAVLAPRPHRRRACRQGAGDRNHGRQDEASKAVFKPYHAVTVPKCMNLGEDAYNGSQPKTTAMLRNIPNRYTQASLLREIDSVGFEGTYDFFYLPMDTHNRTNVGYAFINFLAPLDMERFAEAFSGYRFKDHASQKIGRVSPAHLQGFHKNVQHFSNRAVTHSRNSQYRPVILYHGQQRDLGAAFADLSASMAGPPGLDPSVEEFVPAFLGTGDGFLPSSTGVAGGYPETCMTMEGLVSADDEPAAQEDVTYADMYSLWGMESDQVPMPCFVKQSELEGLNNTFGSPFDSMDVAADVDGTMPLRVPGKYGAPGSQFGTLDMHEPFSLEKNGLELAVSKWLQEKETTTAAETSSTEGASCTPSSNQSPRSTSPAVVHIQAPWHSLPWSLADLWQAQPGQAQNLTPRTNRTLLSNGCGGI